MMPISAEQSRVAVGKMNANKGCPATRHKSGPMTPCEGTRQKPSEGEERREYVANLLTVLYAYFLALKSIVSDLFRNERDESEGSTKKMKAKGKGLHGSLVMLLRLLLFITALLLLMGGDVERNPGPPKTAVKSGIAVHGKRPGSQREEVEGTPSTRQRESGEIGLEKGSWEAENTCRYSSPEKMEDGDSAGPSTAHTVPAPTDGTTSGTRLTALGTSLPQKSSLAVATQSLSTDDLADVMTEIVEAQNQSRYIGLKLKVTDYIVEGIHLTYQQPKDRLYYILLEFLKQVDPEPTWRAIADALKSKLVRLPQLAKKIEEQYCDRLPPTQSPIINTQSEHDGSPIPAHSLVGPVIVAEDSEPMLSTSASSLHPSDTVIVTLYTSVNEIKAAIGTFEDRFKALKRKTRKGLVELGPLASVRVVVERLTDLRADDLDDHKVFLQSNIQVMFRADDHLELFGTLNFHWDYLAYHLLDHLIREFSITEVKVEMEKYTTDLQRFRRATPLRLFCDAQTRKRKPPVEFEEVTVEFVWRIKNCTITLEVVEDFRKEYAYQYKLRDYAMILHYIGIGSFIVTWFVPESIVESLKQITPEKILQKYEVTKLKVAGIDIFDHTKFSPPGSATNLASPLPCDKAENRSTEYDFVEQPSEDFFCPVTKELLLQPQQTTCCGHHLSLEAAARIQGDGGACPICKKKKFTSNPDKYIYRQVQQSRIYCSRRKMGCKWEGELSDLHHHLQSSHVMCTQKKTAPYAREMIRGSATSDHKFAYFIPLHSNAVYCYRMSEDEWMELPPCPYMDSGLAIIDSVLTTIGGEINDQYTNKLFFLRQNRWIEDSEEFPPMRVARSGPAVVSALDGRHLVIGGFEEDRITDRVEVFSSGSRKWSELTSLPQPLTFPSAAICGNQLYVIGSDDDGYSCSLQDSQSIEQIESQTRYDRTVTWTPVCSLPMKSSTAGTLNGQLVIIGGLQDGSPTNCIYWLMDGKNWVKIGSAPCRRWQSFVVNQSSDMIVVVGGKEDFESIDQSLYSVEVYSVYADYNY